MFEEAFTPYVIIAIAYLISDFPHPSRTKNYEVLIGRDFYRSTNQTTVLCVQKWEETKRFLLLNVVEENKARSCFCYTEVVVGAAFFICFINLFLCMCV